MTLIGFVWGLLCGVFCVRFGRLARETWTRLREHEVFEVEPRPADRGLPRALVHTALDSFYVRQLAPCAPISWFREDTGEPVDKGLDGRLHVLLAIERTKAVPA